MTVLQLIVVPDEIVNVICRLYFLMTAFRRNKMKAPCDCYV